MNAGSLPNPLREKRCVPCEGGVPRLTLDEATNLLREVHGWTLLSGPDRISKSWVVRDFSAGMRFFTQITDLAEAEGHHPDLHLVSCRNVTVEVWTHAVQGLSVNDFILAAKIDQLTVDLRAV